MANAKRDIDNYTKEAMSSWSLVEIGQRYEPATISEVFKDSEEMTSHGVTEIKFWFGRSNHWHWGNFVPVIGQIVSSTVAIVNATQKWKYCYFDAATGALIGNTKDEAANELNQLGRRLYYDGKEIMDNGNYANAIKKFENAYSKFDSAYHTCTNDGDRDTFQENKANARSMHGSTLSKQGAYPEAEIKFLEASLLCINPENKKINIDNVKAMRNAESGNSKVVVEAKQIVERNSKVVVEAKQIVERNSKVVVEAKQIVEKLGTKVNQLDKDFKKRNEETKKDFDSIKYTLKIAGVDDLAKINDKISKLSGDDKVYYNKFYWSFTHYIQAYGILETKLVQHNTSAGLPEETAKFTVSRAIEKTIGVGTDILINFPIIGSIVGIIDIIVSTIYSDINDDIFKKKVTTINNIIKLNYDASTLDNVIKYTAFKLADYRKDKKNVEFGKILAGAELTYVEKLVTKDLATLLCNLYKECEYYEKFEHNTDLSVLFANTVCNNDIETDPKLNNPIGKGKCTILAMTYMVYDNPLLNHPELLQRFMKAYGLQLHNDLIKFNSHLNNLGYGKELAEARDGPEGFGNMRMLLGLDETGIAEKI